MSEGKVTGITFKLNGYCIDKDGYISHFTEKDIIGITWENKNE